MLTLHDPDGNSRTIAYARVPESYPTDGDAIEQLPHRIDYGIDLDGWLGIVSEDHDVAERKIRQVARHLGQKAQL